MKNLKQLIETRRAKVRLNAETELKSQFGVVARGESLWLTHCGTAFAEVPSTASAEEVTKQLNMVRESAVKFERL